MTEYAQILMYAIPFFLILIIIEWVISYFKNQKVYNVFDTVSSLSSGMTNIIKDVLGLIVIIISYEFMHKHIAIGQISSNWLSYILAFIALDFAGYWSHRFEHMVNVLWNRHIIHHSSEEFNLACALRQNFSSIFALFTILLIPAAILGVPPRVIAVVAPIQLFAQFWYHTRLIDKMGWLEHIIVTPSHHRVHHAINDIYIDKNFSQIFIIWDKLFGTFQPELDDVIPIYGVKKPVNTWNPVLINFQHVWGIIKDSWRTSRFQDKISIWFKPTGWRPEDVKRKYPISYYEDGDSIQKYYTPTSNLFNIWSIIQLLTTLGLMLHMFSIIDQYSLDYLMLYGLFLVLNIMSYTTTMDAKQSALILEALKSLLVLYLLYNLGSWFGLSSYIIVGFIAWTFVSTGYLIKTEPCFNTAKSDPAV